MSSLRDIRSSKFLKKEDVGEGVLATIKNVARQNVALDGAPEDEKFVLFFNELEKPLVLNSTNAQMIAKISGHEDDIENNWPGVQVVLYDDPNVSYAGKIVGGIRIRAPKPKTQKPDLPF